MKRNILFTVTIILLLVIFSCSLLFISHHNERLFRAHEMLPLYGSLMPDYSEKSEQYRYISSKIDGGKLLVSLYDNGESDRSIIEKTLRHNLSEYSDLLKIKFYTYEELYSLRNELAEYFSDDIYSDFQIRVDRATGKIEIIVDESVFDKYFPEEAYKHICDFEIMHNIDVELSVMRDYIA